MFIKGQTFFLRALEPADTDLLYRWENNMEVWKVSGTVTPLSMSVLEDFVNAPIQDIYVNKQLRLMVGRLSDKKTIGAIDLFDFDPQHDRCGVGILIDEEFRSSGAGAESLSLLKAYCFDTLHLKQIFADVSDSNSSSLALFTKSGFKKVGLKKAWHKVGAGKYEDVWLLQLMNE